MDSSALRGNRAFSGGDSPRWFGIKLRAVVTSIRKFFMSFDGRRMNFYIRPPNQGGLRKPGPQSSKVVNALALGVKVGPTKKSRETSRLRAGLEFGSARTCRN